jgi:hypothetical protein
MLDQNLEQIWDPGNYIDIAVYLDKVWLTLVTQRAWFVTTLAEGYLSDVQRICLHSVCIRVDDV